MKIDRDLFEKELQKIINQANEKEKGKPFQLIITDYKILDWGEPVEGPREEEG